MLEELKKILEDISAFKTRLIFLIGPPNSGKSDALSEAAREHDAKVLNIGADLGRELLALPASRRRLEAAGKLRHLAQTHAKRDLLLLDNLELLFDHTLRLDVLSLLKQLATSHTVIAAWPGEFKQKKLLYASTGHSEHREYSAEGVVTLPINRKAN